MSAVATMYTPAASRAPSARATPQPTGPPTSSQPASNTTTTTTNTTGTASNGDNPRPQKLRLSCDACAGAKVKCNKEHPSCGRCINMGQTCVYSPSRKFGKPSAKKRAQQAAEKQLKSRPLDMHADTRPSTRESMYSGNYSSHFPQFEDFSRHQPMIKDPLVGSASWSGAPLDRHHNSTIGGYGIPQDLVADISTQFPCLEDREPAHFSPPLQINSHGGMPPPGFRDVFDDFMSPVSAGPLSVERSHESSVASTPFLPSPLAIPSDNSLNELGQRQSISTSTSYSSPQMLSKQTSIDSDRHDCYNIASATMASLHYRAERRDSAISTELISPLATPRMGLTDSASCTPSLDQVLRNNKTALLTVSKLLSCPCARNPHNAMLYSSIISKILTWYRVAGGSKNSGTATPVVDLAAVDFRLGNISTISPSVLSNPTSGTSTPTSTFAGSSVAHVPITIGGFSLDEEDQDHLRRQLLMSELRKAERVIESMASRCVEEETPRARHNANLSMGLDDGGDHLQFQKSGMGMMGYDDESASEDDISMEDVAGLYRTLAAWLKSELSKTLSVLRGGRTSKRGSISHASRPSISSRLSAFN